MDFYLDPATRDLWVGDTGQVRTTSGVPEAAAQRLAVTLLMFAGEWFLDLTAGVEYYRSVLVSHPDVDLIRALFRRKVLSDPYVVDVPEMAVTFDSAARSLVVAFQARLREGSEVSILIDQGIVNGALVINQVQVSINGIAVVVNG